MNTPEKEEFYSLNKAWTLLTNMLSRNYLDVLDNSPLSPCDIRIVDTLKKVRIDKITKIVYDKTENNLHKLNNVFSALYSTGNAAFILLKNSASITDIYIGIRGHNAEEASDTMRIFEHALYGNFPGIKKENLDSEEVGILSDYIRDEKNVCISCVTGVPSLKDENTEKFSQGLEKIIEAMGNQNYIALLLAEPISRKELDRVELAFQNIYSSLSVLNISQLSLSEQESNSLGRTITKNISESISTSVAQTHTVTDSNNFSKTTSTTISTSESTSKTRNWDGVAASGAAMVGGAVGSAIGTAAGPVGTVIGGTIGAAVGGIAGGIASTMIGSTTKGTATTTGNTEGSTEGSSHSVSDGQTTTDGKTRTSGFSDGETTNTTSSSGKTYQYEIKDKRIFETLEIIDEQLDRIRDAKNYGAWNWAAYIVAPNTTSAKIGANIFTGILKGEKSGLERCAISLWTKDHRDYKALTARISVFMHPSFVIEDNLLTMPTALLSTPELAIGMSLPKKSLPGIPVFEVAEFGRSANQCSGLNVDETMDIGAVSHLGLTEPQNRVMLNLKSFTSHTFVTGSTGSGKSNAIYMMLDWLHNKAGRIPFLVIEPAKGEYKSVFGGFTRSINVFGTNPYHTQLLRINPFSFPKEMHVMEHIDRLIEILNAVWPMYAAMPAILKEAVEITYKKCGWDLLYSTNKHSNPVFPDFHDLLSCLPEVISASKYADEVKSNYSGALLTRVKSLTNGYYRTIFQKEEIPPEILFDKSCIVDISRVGSSETKSLLMGIVFLKLHEYRMAKSKETNAELRHITVLEEAHNLLRRTSPEQGAETANLQGKSVEMISNAIAEMRTYGEGFIIADQAPGLLDPAVIRNTNTKIVLRLPDYEDRMLVGKAQNLNDAQIDELARLNTGCASVYQNNWQEAVLCQFNKFDTENARPFKFDSQNVLQPDGRTIAEKELLLLLLKGLSGANDIKCVFNMLEADFKDKLQNYYPDFIDDLKIGKIREFDLLCMLNEILVKAYIENTEPSDDIHIWTQSLLKAIFSDDYVQKLPEWLKDILLSATFKLLAIYDKHQDQKDFWISEEKNTMKWRAW